MNTNTMRALVVVFTVAVVAAMSISAKEGASAVSGISTPVGEDTAINDIKDGAETIKTGVTQAADGAKTVVGSATKDFKAPEDKADPVTEEQPKPEGGGCCG